MTRITWNYVEQKHNRDHLVSFDRCKKEPCVTFRKKMPPHHWHGPDFDSGESCCGCGASREEVNRFGNKKHCPDDRILP